MSDLLANDPRTAWAWSEYLETKRPLKVSEKEAKQLLAAIPHGDHVEVFAEGAIFPRNQDKQATSMKRRSGRLTARTLRRWIVVTEGEKAAKVLDGPAEGTIYREKPISREEVSWYTGLDKGYVNVFVDDSSIVQRIRNGAGFDILRLPNWGDTPEAPTVLSQSPSVRAADSPEGDPLLVTDWSAAERVALVHVIGLGFTGARLTVRGRDKGVDVTHPEAVAQVKMQGVPVSAPQVQQLRGARPTTHNHLFYSTSGYTAAAEAEAADSGVALFVIDAVGRVSPKGSLARGLIHESGDRQFGPEAAVAEYSDDVKERVLRALANYGTKASAKYAIEVADDAQKVLRALGYLWTAQDKLRASPEVGDMPLQSIVNYFRHVELLAAVYCRELGYEYPGQRVLGKKAKSLDDFY
ncbi:restriction endonuclease [Pseudarthrobacter enclensis]|uniref:restriction endonuclease n=1 Tax=Pseudarthrobacter enclensis TaxID=993070 RepID=UPI001146F2E0|nr:restriction endonuclease [Pseudarthrobacter enclensis]